MNMIVKKDAHAILFVLVGKMIKAIGKNQFSHLKMLTKKILSLIVSLLMRLDIMILKKIKSIWVVLCIKYSVLKITILALNRLMNGMPKRTQKSNISLVMKQDQWKVLSTLLA
ncbi:hypothetical protein KONIH1_09240 [Klebsiella oxytoca KONIH1]|nr:hypothetical protein KONIH1_09240 [Klebsiella oxytoca KONIH1]